MILKFCLKNVSIFLTNISGTGATDPMLLEILILDQIPALVAELELDLVPQFDVSRQVLVRDGNAADGTSLLFKK